MRYLITGMPRTRSAWLASIMGAYHDVAPESVPAGYGLANPAVAMLWPKAYNVPVIYISREESESRQAFCNYAKSEVTDEWWESVLYNTGLFLSLNPHATVISVNALDSNETVVSIARQCGVDLDTSYVDNCQARYISEVWGGHDEALKQRHNRIQASNKNKGKGKCVWAGLTD